MRTFLLLVCGIGLTLGQMSSSGYTVTTHVLDGGGAKASSSSYQLLNALAQPTPIGTASSPSYSAYLGYLYTLPRMEYLCGDADGDGTITAADGFRILNYLGGSMPPPVSCWAGNTDGLDGITAADGFRILNYLGGTQTLDCAPCTFRGGKRPPIMMHKSSSLRGSR